MDATEMLKNGKTYGVLSSDALETLLAVKGKEVAINKGWRDDLSKSTPHNGITIVNPEKSESRKKLGMTRDHVIVFFNAPECKCYPHLLKKVFVSRVLSKDKARKDTFLDKLEQG